MEGFGKAAENLALILRDACGIVIDPLKKITTGKAERHNKRKELIQNFELEKIQLAERAKLRMYEQEIRRQHNLEQIGQEALKYLPEVSIPDSVEIDWLHFFMDCSKDVSDEILKQIWAKILAGETEPKINTSKNTLETLKTFSAEDCKKFEILCKYIFRFDTKKYGLLFRNEDNKSWHFSEDIEYDDLLHFEYLGVLNSRKDVRFNLFKTESDEGFNRFEFVFTDKERIIKFDRKTGVKEAIFPVFNMSKSGYELARIINSKLDSCYLNNFLNYLDKNDMEYIIKKKH